MDLPLTEQMNALFENAPIGIGIATKEGQILAVNGAFLSKTGYAEDELVGRNVIQIYAEPDQRTDLLEKLSKTDAVQDFGVKLKRKDNSPFYASLNVSKIYLNGQDFLLAVIDDVTEQVELTDQLRREISKRETIEKELQSQISLVDGLLDTTLDTMVIIDSKTLRYKKWNKAVTQVTGYSDEDFSTMNPFEVFFDEEELPRVEAAVEELMREGIVTTSHTHINKDGSKTTLEYTGSVTRDSEGDPQNLIFIGRDITERRQAEEKIQQEVAERKKTEAELQAQLTLFNSLLESVPDTIVINDPHTFKHMKWNDAALRITGYSDEEFAALDPVASFFDEADAQRVQAAVEQGMGEGQTIVSADMIIKDGSRIPMEFTGSLARDDEDNPIYFFAIGRDITKRKQAEQQLQQEIAERKKTELELQAQINLFDSLLDTAADTIEIFDPETLEYIKWNKACIELTGYSDEEFGKMNPATDFFDEADARRVEAGVSEVLKGKEILVTADLIAKDGRRTPMEFLGSLARDAEDNPQYFIAIGRNITERKQYEEALQASEEKYRDLVEKVSDVIYTIDADGKISYVNPAIESLIELTPEQLVGKPIAQYIHPDDLGQLQENVQNLLSGETTGPAEYRVQKKSGETRWIRATSQPIWEDDQVTSLHGVLTDITERKEMEKQLEQEAMIAERDRLARRLHDAVTQTLFSASVIAESTPRIMENNPDLGKRNLEQLAIMLRGALAEMRTMLIELRPQELAGKQLDELMQTLVDGNRVRIGCPVNLKIDGKGNLPEEVTIVFYRIAQEAINNIIKYAEADQVGVDLSYNDGGVELIVSDNGHGFDLTKVSSGQIGLKIMAERIEQIEGELNIASKPGRGTQVKANWSESANNE